MKTIRKIIAKSSAIGAVVVIGSLFVTSAFAAPSNSGTDKPGFGFGDKHHHHHGPPGSNRPSDRFGDHDGDDDDQFAEQLRQQIHDFFAQILAEIRQHHSNSQNS